VACINLQLSKETDKRAMCWVAHGNCKRESNPSCSVWETCLQISYEIRADGCSRQRLQLSACMVPLWL